MSPKKRSLFVGYIRVSTAEQAQEGVSLEAQRAKLEAWAKLHDVTLVDVVADEGVSGSKPLRKRPGGQRVLNMLETGKAQGLAFLRLDRVFRSTLDAVRTVDEQFKRNKWQLASLDEQIDTSTSMGRFMVRLFAALAELEPDKISDRTKEGMEQVKAQGGRFGRAPYGWEYSPDGEVDDYGRLLVLRVPEEQAVIKRAKTLRKRGLSLRAIGDKLAAEGYQTRQGGPWHAKVVRSILGEGGKTRKAVAMQTEAFDRYPPDPSRPASILARIQADQAHYRVRGYGRTGKRYIYLHSTDRDAIFRMAYRVWGENHVEDKTGTL